MLKHYHINVRVEMRLKNLPGGIGRFIIPVLLGFFTGLGEGVLSGLVSLANDFRSST